MISDNYPFLINAVDYENYKIVNYLLLLGASINVIDQSFVKLIFNKHHFILRPKEETQKF